MIEDLKNAWSITWTASGPLIADTSARIWWRSEIGPRGKAALGALTLHSPWIDESGGDGVTNLMLAGSASSIFQSFIKGRFVDTHVIWRNEARPSRVTEISARVGGAVRYYSPYPAENIVNDDVFRAITITNVMEDVASLSRSGGEIPKVLVLDTRISGTDAELEVFFAFLMQQGVRLDLWALKRPASALLSRISQSTIGHTYYSSHLDNVPLNDRLEWMLKVPLPPDLTTYGYPSDATLSVFAAVDVVTFTDWIPIWPSLITRERSSGDENSKEGN
jgi:hypothetical protein